MPTATGHMPGTLQHPTWEWRGWAQVVLLQMLSEADEHPSLSEKCLGFSELLNLKGDLSLSVDGLIH